MPSFAAGGVFDNEDLMWLITSQLTGFECGHLRSEEQLPTRDAAPLLPLLLTFRSLTRMRRVQLGIPLVSMKSQFVTSVSLLEWAVSMGCRFKKLWPYEDSPCPFPSTVLSWTARGGHLEVLQWLRAQDPPCPWDSGACSEAAWHGHLEVLQWLRAQDPPCPWDNWACIEAAAHGQLELLQWLRAQDPPCPWDGYVYSAAECSHVETVQ